MSHRVVPLIVCVVAVAMLSTGGAAQETAANGTTDVDLGSQLTAFTQSSSAAADDTVENEMWNARFNGTNERQRDRIVRNRTGTLTERLTRLRDRNESIHAAYENGSLSRQAYIARQSRLVAQIESLTDAINDTDGAAAQAGVDDRRLETLKRNASELRGPQVASVGSTTPLSNGNSSSGLPDDRTQGPLAGQTGPPLLNPRDTPSERPANASDRSQTDGTPASDRRRNAGEPNDTDIPPGTSGAPGRADNGTAPGQSDGDRAPGRSGQNRSSAANAGAGQQSDPGPDQPGSNGNGQQPEEAESNGNGPAGGDDTTSGRSNGDSSDESPNQSRSNGDGEQSDKAGSSSNGPAGGDDTNSDRSNSDSSAESPDESGSSGDTSQSESQADGESGDSGPAGRSGQSEPAAGAGGQSDTGQDKNSGSDTDNSGASSGESGSESDTAGGQSDSGQSDGTGPSGDTSSRSDDDRSGDGSSDGENGQSQNTKGGSDDNGPPETGP